MSVSARRLTARLTDATKVARKMSRTTSSTPKLTLYNDISDIYFLSSPMLFHKTLDVLLLLCCTYLVRAAPLHKCRPAPPLRAKMYSLAIARNCVGRKLFNSCSCFDGRYCQ